MCTIRECRLAKSTASNDEIESMDNDEIYQRPKKRPRLDKAGAPCALVARQQYTREQSQLGKRYGNISVAGNNTTHIGNRIIHSCDHDHDCGQSRREALLESLTFDRMDARLRNVTRATPKTCDWLFHHKDFEAWLQDSRIAEHHGFLWIKGKPGSGKSTIMKNAWDWAKKRRPKNTIVLSYFFNARAPSALERSCLGLYRSLVHQVLCEVPESKPVFFDRFLSKERNGIVDEWTQEELQDFLIEVVKTIDAPPLKMFIDALDEGDDNDVRKMINFLQELGRHSESSFMRPRICLSSRHYPHISIRNGLSLTVEHQPEHQQDIGTYVQQNFVGENTPQMVELQEKVCSKADGVFLWVVLVICMLKKEYDHGGGILAMTKLLEEIPKGLEGLLADILKRSSEDKESCVSLLQWVLYSTRPLSSAELYLAIQFSQTATSQLDTVLPGKDQLNRRILKYSRGLVEQTKSQPPVIQFIHETVRDFLTGEKGLKQMQSALTGKVQGWSNDKLRYGCLRCIQRCRSPELENGDKDSDPKQKNSALLKSTFPLIDYAVSSLFRHADAAEKNGVSQTTFLQQMQRTDQGDSCNWVQWRNAFERYKVRKYRDDVPLLYILVEYNLLSLIEALVSKSVDLDAVGGRYGTPLQAACFAGHEDIARFLLQNGANVNMLGGEYTHALLAAIYSKKPNIITLLRQYGASLAPEMLTKPLFEMIARNHAYGAQILMEHGVDVKARNRRGETPFYLAATSGREKIVQMLLDAGADVNVQGGSYGNALQAASASGREKIVQMLLDAGADVNVQGGPCGNALQAASASGREKIVQMLLDAGAVG
jgi:Ankyrin repeats (3 copies)